MLSRPVAPPTAIRGLPRRMKVLYVTTLSRHSDWLTAALAADAATDEILLEEVIGATAGAKRLREEAFDAVLITHEPGSLDALEMASGWRAGGGDEPLIVLGDVPHHRIEALCYEAGADDYCCVADTTVRSLLWKFARAIERCRLSREHRRLLQARQQRLQQENQEAQRLLEQQRALVADLESLHAAGSAAEEPPALRVDVCVARSAAANHEQLLALPEPLIEHYRELLRTYVIMGTGNIAAELAKLAALLVAGDVSAQRMIQLHVEVLEDLVQGLGNRSARHVMNRADLLILELAGHLADGYRQRYHERRDPPRQMLLPEFETSANDGHVFHRPAA